MMASFQQEDIKLVAIRKKKYGVIEHIHTYKSFQNFFFLSKQNKKQYFGEVILLLIEFDRVSNIFSHSLFKVVVILTATNNKQKTNKKYFRPQIVCYTNQTKNMTLCGFEND